MGLQTEALLHAVVAGLIASVACGLGALPLLIKRFDPARYTGLGYGFAGGLMFAASVYNLILPGLQMEALFNRLNPDQMLPGENWSLASVLPVLLGIGLGAGFLSFVERFVDRWSQEASTPRWERWGGTVGVLVFLAMTIHSAPEGVAVGTGYAAGAAADSDLGAYIALAIAIHNIPEGLAVSIPLRSAGASVWRCGVAAFLTSLPQPIAAVPALLLAWVFRPLMPILLGFAAGAMLFLLILEIVPHALERESHQHIAWAFTVGFGGMLLVQVVL